LENVGCGVGTMTARCGMWTPMISA